MRTEYLAPSQMVELLAQGKRLDLADPTTGLNPAQVVRAYWTGRYDEQPWDDWRGIVRTQINGRYVAELVTGHVLHGPGPYWVVIT